MRVALFWNVWLTACRDYTRTVPLVFCSRGFPIRFRSAFVSHVSLSDGSGTRERRITASPLASDLERNSRRAPSILIPRLRSRGMQTKIPFRENNNRHTSSAISSGDYISCVGFRPRVDMRLLVEDSMTSFELDALWASSRSPIPNPSRSAHGVRKEIQFSRGTTRPTRDEKPPISDHHFRPVFNPVPRIGQQTRRRVPVRSNNLPQTSRFRPGKSALPLSLILVSFVSNSSPSHLVYLRQLNDPPRSLPVMPLIAPQNL